jgi:hypothetical protein
MSIPITEKEGDVKVYGSGAPGGKGAGLIRINEISLLKVGKLKTCILATDFYDRYLENNCRLGEQELLNVTSILDELGEIPLGIRSSATNEAGRTTAGIGPTTIPTRRSASFRLAWRSAISMMTSAGSSRPIAGKRWPS